MLIAMSGLQATGKTYVSTELASRMDAMRISINGIESAMAAAGLWRNQATGLAAYLSAQSIARENLAAGHDVIIDAANFTRSSRKLWTDLGDESGADVLFLITVCSNQKLHHERVQARRNGVPGVDRITWDDVADRNAHTEMWGTEPRVALDTTREIDFDHVISMVRSFGGEAEPLRTVPRYRPARRAAEEPSAGSPLVPGENLPQEGARRLRTSL
ncbi:AAA family ATPase [uncultured Propionibacterium sp.]|uniref:AAA family ATPase n=1 Tax=uncultured Propionibacterium sp. TaxID=218066 RepID=UPI00292E2E1B|nr:AAA family ATPase [uncultured Propionibacterium sp.]